VLFLLMVTFIGMLYFNLASASLSDSYQPGIEKLQAFLNPMYISFIMLALVILVNSPWLISLSKAYFVGVIIICIFMVIFVSIYHGPTSNWSFPEERTLIDTIDKALAQPSFSNRSAAKVVFNGVISLIALGMTYFVGQIRYNKQNQD